MMDLRYHDDPAPKDYAFIGVGVVQDPTRNYHLVEDGASRTGEPEIIAFRVMVHFKNLGESAISQPLLEDHAVEYETDIKNEYGHHVDTELRPVFGYRAGREKVGPLLGEKWLHHTTKNVPQDNTPVGQVVRWALIANLHLRDENIDGYREAGSRVMEHAQKVACSDYHLMEQALDQYDLPSIPCQSVAHADIFHEKVA